MTRTSSVNDFVDLLQDLAEPLIAAAPDAALRLFIDLLDHALSERYTAPPTSSRRFDDASIIWRPDIGDERDAEARFQPILNSLVDAVVRAARATNDVNDVDPFDLLQGARASVFGRIELQLLAGLSNPCAPNLVSRLLVSRSQLSNQTLELEYLRALRSKADQLATNGPAISQSGRRGDLRRSGWQSRSKTPCGPRPSFHKSNPQPSNRTDHQPSRAGSVPQALDAQRILQS